MMLFAIGLLLASQGPNGPGAPGVPPRDPEGWVVLDGVAAQSGDRVVTLRELDKFVSEKLDRLVEGGKITNPEEFAQASRELSLLGLRQLATDQLEAQGGEDMGLDPVEIDRMISLQMEDERKRVGTAEYIEKLVEEGTDPLADLSTRTESLYRLLWVRSVLGYPGAAGTRPTRDRFIRPGQLKLIFRSNREGLIPPRIRIQTIVMPIAAAGSLEAARATLAGALAQAEAGADFGDLVDQYSSEGRTTRGITEWIRIVDMVDTPLRTWAAEAPVDTFSPIFEMPPGGAPEVLVLVRMHERDDPPPPEFEDERVQKNLRAIYTRRRDDRIIEYENSLLMRDAFLWLNPNLGVGPSPRGQAQEPLLGPRVGPRR